jgi:endonuclease III
MTFDIDHVLNILAEEIRDYQVPVVDLIAVQTRDPFRILVATILSARTKDETTAKAASRLFKKVSDLDSLAILDEATIAKLIYPVGFYKNKAKYLKELPAAMEQFDGRIPDDVDSLTKLPGVGRKTANLVVAVAFNKAAICVDTPDHEYLGLCGDKDPP